MCTLIESKNNRSIFIPFSSCFTFGIPSSQRFANCSNLQCQVICAEWFHKCFHFCVPTKQFYFTKPLSSHLEGKGPTESASRGGPAVRCADSECPSWRCRESSTMMYALPRMPPTDHSNRTTSQWEGVWVGGLLCVYIFFLIYLKLVRSTNGKIPFLDSPLWKEKQFLGKIPDRQPHLHSKLFEPFPTRFINIFCFEPLSRCTKNVFLWVPNRLFKVK